MKITWKHFFYTVQSQKIKLDLTLKIQFTQKWKFAEKYHPQTIKESRWVCFFIRTDLEKLVLHLLLTNGSSTVNGCRQKESSNRSFLQTHSFSHDSNWLTESMVYLWIIMMLLLLFWRHPFTADDPLVSKWCNAKFLQICSNKEMNSSTSWMAWERIHLQQFFEYSFNN